MIKRYDQFYEDMEEEEDGDWVKWEDVKNIIEENEMHRKYDAECW